MFCYYFSALCSFLKNIIRGLCNISLGIISARNPNRDHSLVQEFNRIVIIVDEMENKRFESETFEKFKSDVFISDEHVKKFLMLAEVALILVNLILLINF